jgi:hypothetical protein
MAVPSSGTLTMLGLARERKYSSYVSTGIIPYPILMTDLINGGGLNAFLPLNTNSPSKPNTSIPHSMSEWYSYDQDYVPPVACDDIELRFTNKYKAGSEACFAVAVQRFTTEQGKWFTVPLYADGDCKEGIWAASGAYSDGSTWGVWDGLSGQWTDQGICEM